MQWVCVTCQMCYLGLSWCYCCFLAHDRCWGCCLRVSIGGLPFGCHCNSYPAGPFPPLFPSHHHHPHHLSSVIPLSLLSVFCFLFSVVCCPLIPIICCPLIPTVVAFPPSSPSCHPHCLSSPHPCCCHPSSWPPSSSSSGPHHLVPVILIFIFCPLSSVSSAPHLSSSTPCFFLLRCPHPLLLLSVVLKNEMKEKKTNLQPK